MKIDKVLKVTGQFSDGSDRQEITQYIATTNSNGRTYQKVFDHEPTQEELLDINTFQDITNAETVHEQLNKLDTLLTRGEEDLIDLMLSKNMIASNELNPILLSRKLEKQQLRDLLNSL